MGSMELEGVAVEVEVKEAVEVELEEELDDEMGVGVEVLVGVGVGVSVDVSVSVGVGVGVGVEVGVEVEVSVEVSELVGVGVGVGVLVLDEVAGLVGSELLESSLAPISKTTMLALEPGGTVTTQPVAPPAPMNTSKALIWLTSMLEGSILQGRPLQPSPSHSISIPKLGLTLRKGVVGSR